MDDEPAILAISRLFLEKAGYEVGTAANGLQGLQSVQDGHWDAVITDRSMPLMDGEDMTRAIQVSRPSMPVILITGLPTAIIDRSLFDAIVSKPFGAEEIIVILQRLCPHDGQSKLIPRWNPCRNNRDQRTPDVDDAAPLVKMEVAISAGKESTVGFHLGSRLVGALFVALCIAGFLLGLNYFGFLVSRP